MYNILLDPLPKDWNGYPIDTDFQTGIMISQCLTDDSLSDLEKFYVAAWLLFPTDSRPDNAGIGKAINWYMTDFLHDNYPEKKRNDVVMDWDIGRKRSPAKCHRKRKRFIEMPRKYMKSSHPRMKVLLLRSRQELTIS